MGPRIRGDDSFVRGIAQIKKDQLMKIIDMTHVMNVHTPGWVGYAGNKMYYTQNLQTQMIVAQRIDTALHVGTHFDGAMHATDNRKGDMASLPLDYLVNRGVVVDISRWVADWSVITPDIIERAGADIREGDILVLHTGWHRHYEGRPQQDLVKYFCHHPAIDQIVERQRGHVALAAVGGMHGAVEMSAAVHRGFDALRDDHLRLQILRVVHLVPGVADPAGRVDAHGVGEIDDLHAPILRWYAESVQGAT